MIWRSGLSLEGLGYGNNAIEVQDVDVT